MRSVWTGREDERVCLGISLAGKADLLLLLLFVYGVII